MQRVQVDSKQIVEKGVEIGRERPVEIRDVGVQPLARQDAQRHIHFASVIDDRMRPALPRRCHHHTEQHCDSQERCPLLRPV